MELLALGFSIVMHAVLFVLIVVVATAFIVGVLILVFTLSISIAWLLRTRVPCEKCGARQQEIILATMLSGTSYRCAKCQNVSYVPDSWPETGWNRSRQNNH